MSRSPVAPWFGSIGVGIAVGAMGLLMGAWLASHAVDWYRIPSREGGSGYFVAFQALAALVVGGVHIALLAMVGTVARLMADVPPTDAAVHYERMARRLHLFPRAVLDTRTRTVPPLPLERSDDEILKIGPLSPDEKHFARLVRASDNSNAMRIEQVLISDNARRTVPTGFAITGTGDWHDADRDYFDHYFAWEAQAGGVFQVVPRAGANRLAHRGSVRESVGYREYRLSQGLESLREALIAELVKAFGAERVPTPPDAFARQVRINGEMFNHSQGEDGEIVIWMENHDNMLPMVKLARHLDSVLGTRRLDAHFKPPDTRQ